MIRHAYRTAIIGAAATTAACKNRVPLAERDVRIGAAPVVLHFGRPYHAAGPTRELCLEPASEADRRARAPGGPASERTPVLAVLLGTAGRRDTLGRHDAGPSLIFGSGRSDRPSVDSHGGSVCLWDHGLSNPANAALVRYTYDSAGRVIGSAPPEHPLPVLTAEYTAVELRSDVPVRVRAATFWAGQRAAAP